MARSGSSRQRHSYRAASASTRPHPAGKKHFERLEVCRYAVPTWIQSCVFALDGAPPDEAEQAAYLAMIRRMPEGARARAGCVALRSGAPFAATRGLAAGRASGRLDGNWAEAIRKAGLPVKLTPMIYGIGV